MSEIEASSTFGYTVTRGEDEATLVASGEIDLASSPELRQELQRLIDAGERRIVVDLSAVTFIDSSGLGVLVGVLKRLDDAGGGALQLRGLTGPVRKVFEITGLHEVFTITDTAG